MKKVKKKEKRKKERKAKKTEVFFWLRELILIISCSGLKHKSF